MRVCTAVEQILGSIGGSPTSNLLSKSTAVEKELEKTRKNKSKKEKKEKKKKSTGSENSGSSQGEPPQVCGKITSLIQYRLQLSDVRTFISPCSFPTLVPGRPHSHLVPGLPRQPLLDLNRPAYNFRCHQRLDLLLYHILPGHPYRNLLVQDRLLHRPFRRRAQYHVLRAPGSKRCPSLT